MKPTQLPLVETMKEEDFDFADSAFFSPEELTKMENAIDEAQPVLREPLPNPYAYGPNQDSKYQKDRQLKFKKAIKDPDSPVGMKVIELDNEIDKVITSATISAGANLYQIQQILSNPHHGDFNAYLEWKGISKTNAYRFINSYKLVVPNGNNYQILEALPIRDRKSHV